MITDCNFPTRANTPRSIAPSMLAAATLMTVAACSGQKTPDITPDEARFANEQIEAREIGYKVLEVYRDKALTPGSIVSIDAGNPGERTLTVSRQVGAIEYGIELVVRDSAFPTTLSPHDMQAAGLSRKSLFSVGFSQFECKEEPNVRKSDSCELVASDEIITLPMVDDYRSGQFNQSQFRETAEQVIGEH